MNDLQGLESLKDYRLWARIATPYLVWLGLSVAASKIAFQTFQKTWFLRAGPDATPPWYFIGQDATSALTYSAAAGLMLLFFLFALRKLGPFGWASLGTTIPGCFDEIGGGVNILLNTSHLFDQQLAVSAWPNFEAYLASIERTSTISMAISLVFTGFCLYGYARSLRAAGGVH